MSDLDNENRLLNGVLRDLIEATVGIGDRKATGAGSGRSVDDTAIDPWRIALSDDYKRSLAFLEGTKKRARELTQDIKRHTAEYDAVND